MEHITRGFRMSDGDWICSDPHCANINFARRNKCNRCSKDKGDAVQKKKLGQEIGKALADKSRGLFSADDWQCNKCGNVNWARRQQCNMCNAPKYGEVEERTGYGGGYNDRGVVEYIERDESDGEYDEFGRKKRKKSSNPTKQSGCADGSGKNSTDLGREDDDDDEGDDGDLSKYDLSGWGDDEEESENQKEKDRDERSIKNNKNEKFSSRSRSRSPPNGRS